MRSSFHRSKCETLRGAQAFLRRRRAWLATIAGGLALAMAGPTPAAPPEAGAADAASCLPDGKGFLRARIDGAVKTELEWGNAGTQCSGSIRPNGGLRLRFKRNEARQDSGWTLLFGITDLKEGQSAKALPVNVTLIREGSGDFYGTQGDHRCTIDEVSQEPLAGIPLRNRSYRVTARGFCTQPARAVKGSGAVLISRFDFAGRVDFSSDDEDDAKI